MISSEFCRTKVLPKYGRKYERQEAPKVPSSGEKRDNNETWTIGMEEREGVEEVEERQFEIDHVVTEIDNGELGVEYVTCGVCLEGFEYTYSRIEPPMGFLLECEECEAMNICHDCGMPRGTSACERDCCALCGKECCQSCGITTIVRNSTKRELECFGGMGGISYCVDTVQCSGGDISTSMIKLKR